MSAFLRIGDTYVAFILDRTPPCTSDQLNKWRGASRSTLAFSSHVGGGSDKHCLPGSALTISATSVVWRAWPDGARRQAVPSCSSVRQLQQWQREQQQSCCRRTREERAHWCELQARVHFRAAGQKTARGGADAADQHQLEPFRRKTFWRSRSM